jgi:hypothetical protein
LKRKFVALVLLGLMLGALFVPTAAHAQFAGALTVDCTLAFPSPGGNTNCSGSGFGATAAPAACVGCTVTVNASYSEPCPVPVGFPVLGLASGTISAGGETGEFDWVRVGVTAVIVPLTGDSAGVGILVPHAPVGDCSAPNPSQEITVVAVGAAGLPI